jgi:TP901 family phage tail tape measure protein
MPTNLKLEALVDFVLKASKIDDSKLVRQIQSSLAKTKLPPLSIQPVFDIDDKAFQKAFQKKGVLTQLDSQIDAIEKRMDTFADTVNQQAKASAKKLGVDLGGDTEKGQQAQQRVDALIRQGTSQLASQRQVLTQARVAERALQEFYQTTAGKQLPETLKTIQKLQSGAILKKDLDAATVSNIRKTTAFLEERAVQLGAIEKAALRLEKKVRGPQAADVETGAAGRPLIPGVPVYTPELRNQAADLRKAARDANLALDDQKVAKYQKSFDGLKEKLKQASTGFGQFTRAIKKYEGLPFVEPLKSDMAAVKGEIDGIRSSFKEAQKIKEFGPRSEAFNRLYSELEKKEQGIAQVRSNLDKQIHRQRELELGRYLKNFREVTASSNAQAEAEQGRRLLKGARVPETLLPKITEPVQGRQVMAALQEQIVATTDKMSKYSLAARAAGESTSQAFTNQSRKLVQLEQLWADVAQRTRDLFSAGTAAGRQESLDRSRALGVDYRKQVGQLSDLNGQLEALSKNVAQSRLGDMDLSKTNEQLGALDQRAQKLRQSLSAVGTLEDLDERTRASKVIKDELGLLDREVKRFTKNTNKQITSAAQVAAQTAAETRIAAGTQVLERLGAQAGFADVKSVTDMRNAVEALQDRYNRARSAADEFASTVKKGSAEGATELSRLQQIAEKSGTKLTDARNRLRTLDTAGTHKGITDLGKQIENFGKKADNSLDSSNARLGSFGKSLKKLVAEQDFDALSAQARRLEERLNTLRSRRPVLEGAPTEAFRSQMEAYLTDVQDLQRGIDQLRQEPISRQRARDFAEAERLREGIEADRLARERVLAGRNEAARLARERRVPGQPLQSIPPLVLAAQLAPAERQLDVMAAIRDESERLTATEDDRLARAARGGVEEEARLRRKIQLQKQSAAEAERILRERGEVEFPEQARPLAPLTDAQIKAAKDAYGIDLRELEARQKGMAKLARNFENEITNIESRRAELQKQLGPAGARANKEFQDLGQRLPTVKKELGLIRKETESFNRAAASIQSLTTPEEVQKVLASRAIEGRRLVDAAGGAAGLSQTLRGVPREDRARLPLVRETLRQQLGATLAQMDKLASRAGGRATDEFKKSQVEANQLRKAITRVNTELVGYTKLTAQIGGLFRQFARYGIGYASLYQALAGVRALVSSVTDLDSALVSIQAVTQTTDKQMRIIEGSIKRVAVQTKFTTNEIAQAGQVLAQAGVLPQDFPEALSATAQFAAATESSMQISADLLSTMRNVFTELNDLDIANQLTRAVNISKLTAADLKTILSLSGQVAKGYNLASEQYLGAVTTLRNAGIKASTVATGLRQALIEVFAPDTKSLKLLASRYEQLGETRTPEEISQRFFQFSQQPDPALEVLRELRRLGFTTTGKATFAGRTFDVRAENVIKGLITRLDEYVSSQAQIVFGNAAVTASMQQMEALNASMSNLGAAITATAHNLSQDLLPAIEDFVDGVTEIISDIGDFDSKLRASVGNGALSTLGSGGLALALSAATSKNDLGFAKASLRNIGALGVGTAASAGAQEVAGEFGASSGDAKFIGDFFALLATVLLFVEKPFARLKGLYSLLKGKTTAIYTATTGAVTGATAVAKSAGLLKTTWQALTSVVGVLTKTLRALPIGRLFGLIGLLGGAITLFNRYTGNSELVDAQNKLRQAEKNSVDARAERKLLEQQLETYRLSSPGFEPKPGSIGGKTEQLERDLADLDAGLLRYFDKVDGEFGDVEFYLRELERTGFAEGSPARNNILQQLQALTSVDLSLPGNTREELNRLQALLAKTDNVSAGLLKELQESQRQFQERREELAGLPQGIAHLVAEQTADATGFAAALDGTTKATGHAIAGFFKAWLKSLEDSKESLEALTEKLEAEKAFEQASREAIFQGIISARTPAEAAQRARETTRVSTDEEGFQRERERRIFLEKKKTDLQFDLAEFDQRIAARNAERGRRPTISEAVEDFTQRQELKSQIAKLQAATEVRGGKLLASIEESRDVLEERREVVRGQLNTLQFLKDTAPNNQYAANALASLATQPSSRESGAALEDILEETGNDFKKAAELIVQAQNEGKGRITPLEDPGIKKYLEALAPIETNVLAKAKAEDTRALTYLETEAALARAKELGLIELEIKKRERAQRYGDLDELIAKRKTVLVAQIQGEIDFVKKQPLGTGARAEAARQTKLDQLNLRLLNAQFQYENDINEANRKEVAVREKQLNLHLKRLKVLAEAKVTTGGFTDFEGLGGLEGQYRKSLAELVATVRERARIQDLSPEETESLVDAVRQGATSIRAFTEIYGKIIVASQRYIRAIETVAAPGATTPTTDLDTEIVRRERGIRPSSQVRLRSLEVRTNAARQELQTRQQARTQAQQTYIASVEAGADPDVIKQNLDQLAQAEAGVQELIDRVVELRRETMAVSLDIGGALRNAFDPEAIFGTFRERAESDIFTLAEDIRTLFGDVFDDVAGDFADALFDDDDSQSLQDRLRNTFDDFFKDLGKRITEAYFKQAVIGAVDLVAPGALEPKENGDNSILAQALGIGGKTKGQYETVEVDGKTVIVNGLVQGLPQSGTPGDETFVGPLRHPGDPKSVLFEGPRLPKLTGDQSSPDFVGPRRPPAEIEEAEEASAGFFSSVKDNFFKVTDTIGSSLASLGTSITGLFGKLFGGGEKTNSAINTGFAALGQFKAKDGGVIKAGMGASRRRLQTIRRRAGGGIIKGPGTETSDSIPGVIVDDAGIPQGNILVSNKEAILNARATAALGEDTINYLNANAKRFANGGLVSGGSDLQAVSSSLTRSTRQRAVPAASGGADVDNLAEALIASMESSEPRTMSLQVDDSSLNRTLRDYLEGYFADVVAGR